MIDRLIINATINGDEVEFLASERDSLLEALRDRVGQTGTKEGWNNGNVGAGSGRMDGGSVN